MEARWHPHYDATEAVYSLKAAAHRIAWQIETAEALKNFTLSTAPSMKIPRALEIQAQRLHSKPRIQWRNLYGRELPHNKRGTMTAAIHISFTNPEDYIYETKIIRTWNAMFDFCRLFRALDSEFANEIRESGRKPGFYELKADGRIEYRSLPANVPLETIPARITNAVNFMAK